MASQQYLFLDQQRYRIHTNEPVSLLPERVLSEGRSAANTYLPLTVVHWSKGSFRETDRQSLCRDFAKSDDVWNTAFASR
jgi:hypothetical protein